MTLRAADSRREKKRHTTYGGVGQGGPVIVEYITIER